MTRTKHIALAFCLTASMASAQGVITDGDVAFEYALFDIAGGAFTNFEVDNGTDHMFSHWWYFRFSNDSSESVLPAPDSGSYEANVATLEWANINGRDLSATQVSTVIDTGEAAASVRHDLTLTNNSVYTLEISVFNYTDLDVDMSAAEDLATDLTMTSLAVMETSLASYRGLGADAFQVTPFLDLRAELEDNKLTDLDNSGLPFGPGDFTGGFQWHSTVLPVGKSMTFTTVHKVNDTSAPLEIAFSGSCPGAVDVRIAGATPGELIALAGGSTFGSFTIPSGDCVGTVLNLEGPGLLGTVAANGAGQINASLNLPSSRCDQIVQAIDLSTCEKTNTDPIP